MFITEHIESETITTEIVVSPQDNICEEVVSLPNTEVATFDCKVEWTEEAVNLLLDQYQQLLLKFRNPSVVKRPLWQKIHQAFLENGFKLSEQQVINKWAVLKRLHKKSKGAETQEEERPEFMDRVAQLLEGDDFIDEAEDSFGKCMFLLSLFITYSILEKILF
jgi:hypothetical protein